MAAVQYIGKRNSPFKDYLRAILVAVLIAVLIRHFLLEAYRIPSAAMAPTLQSGDIVFINKLSYFSTVPFTHKILGSVKPPTRGEVVVFTAPNEGNKRFVKRVLAIAGDEVQYKDGVWKLNGNELKGVDAGDYLQYELDGKRFKRTKSRAESAAAVAPAEINMRVPGDALFVVGDNEAEGIDSRQFGFVPVANVRGRAVFVGVSYDAKEGKMRWDRLGKGIE